MTNCAGGSGTGNDWEVALEAAIGGAAAVARPDLAFLFVHSAFAAQYGPIARSAYARLGAARLIGCSGQGVIATRRELEREPAIVLLTLALPGAEFTPLRLDEPRTAWPPAAAAWLLFADPFSVDAEQMLADFAQAYPRVPLIGGMASTHTHRPPTALFLDGEVYTAGAVALGVGGAARLLPIVSQGCMPIGQPWTITGVRDNLIETIGSRPAVEVLVETLHALDEETRQRAQQNLLVGLAMDEYRDTHAIGDYLIRNLLGYRPEDGALAIGALPRVGQTVQFQMRDARAAAEHLRRRLHEVRQSLDPAQPAAALVCSCNGRGEHLFGPIDHDPNALAEAFGAIPVAGLFCNGEIGPVGGQNFLHSFTATVALFTSAGDRGDDGS